jgi:hypothetical protein
LISTWGQAYIGLEDLLFLIMDGITLSWHDRRFDIESILDIF